jgi:hypothetical protein
VIFCPHFYGVVYIAILVWGWIFMFDRLFATALLKFHRSSGCFGIRLKACLAALTATAFVGATDADPFSAPVFDPVDIPHHVYDGGWEYYVGGGMAVFDCDQDHMPDMFAAGGANKATLLRNVSTRSGDIRFVENTPPELSLDRIIGAYPLDINSDGFMDLAILRVGENKLLMGGVDCRFTPHSELLEKYEQGWSTAFSATWEEGNVLPTLAFGNYVDRTDPEGPFGTCDTNFLFRPEGSRYVAPIVLEPGYCPLSMLFTDWGRRGQADLRVSNDRHYYLNDGEEQMWQMAEVPRLYQPEDGWQHHKLWGMGIASRDITGDGLPEVYLTSMGDQRLQMLNKDTGGPSYRDATYGRGTTAHRPYTGGDGRPSTGWHVRFGDVQNDGLDDIFITKGNVQQMPGSAMDDPNNLLLQAADGTFYEAGENAGIASLLRGRGGAMADLNLDGLLDLAVVNRQGPLELYQNVTQGAGNWLAVKLRQAPPNRDAIGAWIEVRLGDHVFARELTVGGGHAGGQITAEHFGLGSAQSAHIRVIWPDHTVSDWRQVGAGKMVFLTRDATGLKVSAY